MINTKTVILGPEYDQELRKRLSAVLATLGAKIDDRSWGVGGSQEVMEIDATVLDSTLHIEAETYIGLSISGVEELVDKVIALVNQETRV
jgi:hypothetical protein